MASGKPQKGSASSGGQTPEGQPPQQPADFASQVQAKPSKKGGTVDFDHFLLEGQFTDPKQILTLVPKTLAELKGDCLFALDANALLAPLQLGAKSLPEIRRVYETLVKDDRLFIPARALREFGKRRNDMLQRLYQTINNRRNTLKAPEEMYSPMLDGHAGLARLGKAMVAIRSGQEEYRKAADALLMSLREWQWKDPVSSMLRELLADKNVDHELSAEDLIKDLRYRNRHELPPGFKDSDKADEGIGDVAIWHTLVRLGKLRQKSVVFVTGETKTDWVVRDDAVVLCPRFELEFEFYRETQQWFSLVSFSRFLELIGANKEVVKQAEDVAAQEPELTPIASPLDAADTAVLVSRLLSRVKRLDNAIQVAAMSAGPSQLKVSILQVEAQLRNLRVTVKHAAAGGVSKQLVLIADQVAKAGADYGAQLWQLDGASSEEINNYRPVLQICADQVSGLLARMERTLISPLETLRDL